MVRPVSLRAGVPAPDPNPTAVANSPLVSPPINAPTREAGIDEEVVILDSRDKTTIVEQLKTDYSTRT